MMRKLKILGVIFIVSIQFVIAQELSKTNTMLFRITSTKHDHISYLFGTHHAFGKPFFDALTNANQCLAECDLLIKENIDIPGHLAEDIINRRTEITKWEKYLNNEDLGYIKNLFAKSPTDFNKMTPAELHVFLNRYYKEQICLSKKTNGTHQSLDNYIGLKAEQMNIPQIGLETTEAQIELINKDVEGMPRKIHKKRLSSVIDRIKSNNTDGCSEIDWYERMEFDYKLNQPCQNELVLADRNRKWLDEIKVQLQENNCFIAVGLSHLMFECGLINQLEDLGYTIEPVEVK